MRLTPLLGLGDVVGTTKIIRITSQPARLALGVTGLAAFWLLTETLTMAITPIREEYPVAVLADTFGYDAAHPAKSSKLTRDRKANPHRKKTKKTPREEGRRQSWWNEEENAPEEKSISQPAVSEEYHSAAVIAKEP